MTDSLNNPIEQYFTDENTEIQVSKELFSADSDVDLKTDLSIQEIVLINAMNFNSMILKDVALSDVFADVVNSYERLKISVDRKSRGEFVDINRKYRFDEQLGKVANLKNLLETKQ